MLKAITEHFQVVVHHTKWCDSYNVIVAGSRGNLVATDCNGEVIIAFYDTHDRYLCDGYDFEDTVEKYNRLIK